MPKMWNAFSPNVINRTGIYVIQRITLLIWFSSDSQTYYEFFLEEGNCSKGVTTWNIHQTHGFANEDSAMTFVRMTKTVMMPTTKHTLRIGWCEDFVNHITPDVLPRRAKRIKKVVLFSFLGGPVARPCVVSFKKGQIRTGGSSFSLLHWLCNTVNSNHTKPTTIRLILVWSTRPWTYCVEHRLIDI